MRRDDKIFLIICAVTEVILLIETQFLEELALECLCIWTIISLIGLIKILWDMCPIKVHVEEVPAEAVEVVKEVKKYETYEEDRVCRSISRRPRMSYDCPL